MRRLNIRMRVTFLLVGAVLILAAVLLARSTQPPALSAEVVALNSDAAAGFARADHVRPLAYPDDQGPHPEYQTEWWYYTGNLATTTGRHFGYQLTIFRRALTPTLTTRESDWATNQIYFAHFAVTDVQANEHFATERFSRGAAGLAGATGNPHRVWLEDWEIKQTPLPAAGATGSAVGPLQPPGYGLQLRAADSGHALALSLRSLKPFVLHGDHGLSQKSAAAGNASYYASLTDLETTGTVTVNGQSFDVKGTSWMDQEFGTTSLGPQAVGWDWFSVQLGDGHELMLFQIRQKDGSIEPLSGGTLVNPDGSTRHLLREEISVSVLDKWTSPATHATYPARWRLAIPSANIDMTLRPYIPDQEMRVSFTYWEGAVEIAGTSAGAPVKGSGYVELTGYAAPLTQ